MTGRWYRWGKRWRQVRKEGRKDFRSLRSVAREKIARGAAGPARWTLWVVPVRIPGCFVGFARPTPVLTIAGWDVRNRWRRRRQRRQPFPPLRDQSSCVSTTPGFGDGIASFNPRAVPTSPAGGRDGHSLSFRSASPAFCTTRWIHLLDSQSST